jgi:ankyrin repeat protein
MQKRYSDIEIIAWTKRREGGRIHTSAALSEIEYILSLLSLDSDLINQGDAENATPLHYACAVGSLDTIISLIQHGANINATNFHDETPLLWALLESDIKKRHGKITYLIKNGANINKANVEGETIAHQAFRDPILTLHLLQHDANPNAKNIFDWTPLHYAMLFEDSIESAKHLIDYNANINSLDDEGFTPLHLAAKHNNIDAIKLLISSGADLTIQNKYGQTAYDLACSLELDNKILTLLK